MVLQVMLTQGILDGYIASDDSDFGERNNVVVQKVLQLASL